VLVCSASNQIPKSQYGLCDHCGGGILVEAHWMNAPLAEPKLLASRSVANKRRICYPSRMDEGRKRVIGIMAAILASLHMQTADDLFGTPQGSPRTDKLIAASIQWAEQIMKKIDNVFSG
jgi:hypothetical protein